MIAKVKAYRAVLEYMEETFAEMNSDKAETGYLGNHWKNISGSLTDGHSSRLRLQKLLESANMQVRVLDTVRR
jgi:hypothetical protein